MQNVCDKWDIHSSEWQRVACKARVKKVIATIEAAGQPIASIYISPSFGSVYIDIGVGEFDADYECYDQLITVRVSNHERTSSAHASPDFNIYDSATMTSALNELEIAA